MMGTQMTTVVFPHYRHNATGELRLVGKRYVPKRPSLDGPTLLFFHCTASYKEVWEPTIEHIFQFQNNTGACFVREAWSFDMQNAGEGAVVNANVLSDENMISLEDWADGVKAFVASGRLDGHHLVAVGHSAGTCLIGLTTGGGGYPAIQYKAIVLVEPSITTWEAALANKERQQMAISLLIKSLHKRRRFWTTREEARAYFAEKDPWKLWDPRILDLLVQHGLRDVTVKDTEAGPNKVTLCCTPKQEIYQFERVEHQYLAAEHLTLTATPIYVILAEHQDFIQDWSYNSLINGLKITSIRTVPGAGHLVVQQTPVGVANAIAEILGMLAGSATKARARM